MFHGRGPTSRYSMISRFFRLSGHREGHDLLRMNTRKRKVVL